MAQKCEVISDLKTGRLAGSALDMTGLCLRANTSLRRSLFEFGRQVGIVLQIFDDLGNAKGQKEPLKKYEDLRAGRLSWVWGMASVVYSQGEFERFLDQINMSEPEQDLDHFFLETEFFARSQLRSLERFDRALAVFENEQKENMQPESQKFWDRYTRNLRDKLENAYV